MDGFFFVDRLNWTKHICTSLIEDVIRKLTERKRIMLALDSLDLWVCD